MTSATPQDDNTAILACTISRDVQNFEPDPIMTFADGLVEVESFVAARSSQTDL